MDLEDPVLPDHLFLLGHPICSKKIIIYFDHAVQNVLTILSYVTFCPVRPDGPGGPLAPCSPYKTVESLEILLIIMKSAHKSSHNDITIRFSKLRCHGLSTVHLIILPCHQPLQVHLVHQFHQVDPK